MKRLVLHDPFHSCPLIHAEESEREERPDRQTERQCLLRENRLLNAPPHAQCIIYAARLYDFNDM
uniref:Uncharacterized protein n=1 Tax=Anguilla anguilla TaxID=7936 RepID=A0A0E9W7J8_ANGAN